MARKKGNNIVNQFNAQQRAAYNNERLGPFAVDGIKPATWKPGNYSIPSYQENKKIQQKYDSLFGAEQAVSDNILEVRNQYIYDGRRAYSDNPARQAYLGIEKPNSQLEAAKNRRRAFHVSEVIDDYGHEELLDKNFVSQQTKESFQTKLKELKAEPDTNKRKQMVANEISSKEYAENHTISQMQKEAQKINNEYNMTPRDRYINEQRSRSIDSVWDEAHDLNSRGGLTQNQFDAQNTGYSGNTPQRQRRMAVIKEKQRMAAENAKNINNTRNSYLYEDGTFNQQLIGEAYEMNASIDAANKKKWANRDLVKQQYADAKAKGPNSSEYQSLQQDIDSIKYDINQRTEYYNSSRKGMETFDERVSRLRDKRGLGEGSINGKLSADDASFLRNTKPYVATKIPTQSAIRETGEKAAKEVTETAAEATAKNAQGMLKGISKTKVGRIAAAVGVGAMVVSNMNKNKGQQPNSQLYGQQTPYSY